MDIEGLGDKLVEQLVDEGIVSSLPGLYKLGVAKLSALERMADRSALNLLESLEKSKQTTLARFSVRAWDSPSRRGHGQGFGASVRLYGCLDGGYG